MSEIRTESWDEFTSQVANAVQGGQDVQVTTDTPGYFTADVDGGSPAGDDDGFEDTSEDGDDLDGDDEGTETTESEGAPE
jgi:hypothetical protein